MTGEDDHGPARWRSRTTFFLALSGAAIGLGNFWRLPYLMGEHGGGAFFVLYLAFLLLLAAPLLAAEVFAGVHGRSDPVGSVAALAAAAGLSRRWSAIGYLLVFTALLALGACALMGGLAGVLLIDMWRGEFAAASAVNMQAYLEQLLAEPLRLVLAQGVFLLPALAITALGVRAGLALFFWLAIPALLVIVAVLVRFGLDYGDVGATGDFLLAVDWSRLTPAAWLLALGQALFSLGAGVGAGIAFGAHAPKAVPVLRSVLAVALLDGMVAVAAGLAIFPVLFAANLEPDSGAALLLVAMPIAYGGMTEGEVFGGLFYLAVVLALLSTAVAMLEPVVSVLRGRLGLTRLRGAALAGLVAGALGASFALSLASPSAGQGAPALTSLALVDAAVARLLWPLGALLLALLVGWRIGAGLVRATFDRAMGAPVMVWRLLLRIPVPVAIVVTMVLAAAEPGG